MVAMIPLFKELFFGLKRFDHVIMDSRSKLVFLNSCVWGFLGVTFLRSGPNFMGIVQYQDLFLPTTIVLFHVTLCTNAVGSVLVIVCIVVFLEVCTCWFDTRVL